MLGVMYETTSYAHGWGDLLIAVVAWIMFLALIGVIVWGLMALRKSGRGRHVMKGGHKGKPTTS
jgi:hypothetical protein